MNNPPSTHSPAGKSRLITRRNTLRLIGGGLTLAGASAFNAWCIEPDCLSITRRNIPCKNLPPGLSGLRIGLITDVHFRPGVDDHLLEKVVARANAEKLDLIALGGDYMSDDPKVIAPMLGHMRHLTAAQGVFAVLGNHDGWRGNPPLIRRQFETAGISFLINQHSILPIRGDSLAVAGTDFIWRGKPDPARTFRGLSRKTPVLALVHEPDYFDTLRATRDIMLQVSGHTHGGQCRVPILGIVPRTVPMGKKYLRGLFIRENSGLFVSRGVGTSGPRVRFACLPELAVLTLRPAARS